MLAYRAIQVTEKHSAVRVRTFKGVAAEEVIGLLRSERFTGKLVVDMSQGAVCVVSAEDRGSLPHLTSKNDSV